jgi:hypothetical protein
MAILWSSEALARVDDAACAALPGLLHIRRFPSPLRAKDGLRPTHPKFTWTS